MPTLADAGITKNESAEAKALVNLQDTDPDSYAEVVIGRHPWGTAR
jgi:hypothetical protein